MGVRSAVATVAGRLVRWGLHDVLHRHASQLPGRVVLAIDPQAIAHLGKKVREGTVVVCGTNGKTTTTNVIAAALEGQGFRVLCNHDGANMAAGVTSALLPGSSADWAVLEADELSCIHILPQLKPNYLVLLNLFRDQLDRAGEIDHVQDVIVSALAASPNTTLIVCGDDPLSMGVAVRAHEAGTKVLAFGINEDLHLPPDRVPEARFCQRCGAELSYHYRTYAQLGFYFCPSCEFARPPLDYAAMGVHVGGEGVAFDLTMSHQQQAWHINAPFGGVYMVYNLMAAAVVASLAGVDNRGFQRALESYDPENGRLQHFEVDGRHVVLNLAKNPTGLNQNISLAMTDGQPKALYVVINDDYNDGRDVSWLWDVDFERLAGRKEVLLVIAGGHRANDLQVRFKYAGISAPLAGTVSEALAIVSEVSGEHPLYVLTNYSALWPAKAELERLGERHG
ncbi:MAG: MurT ligase domain-containing protein [Atopobiaceae bacterium]|nr:MurT ligase domain-containing protein [Atopobiaceae bacterium]